MPGSRTRDRRTPSTTITARASDRSSLGDVLETTASLEVPESAVSKRLKVTTPDVVIVIAKKEEYEFVQPFLPPGVVPLPDSVTHHSEADFDLPLNLNARPLRAKLVRLSEAGEVRTCAVLLRVLWKMALANSQANIGKDGKLDKRVLPRLIVNLGIAATMKDEVRLGDVVVANHIVRYMEDQKCVDRPKKDGFTFTPRPDTHTKVDTATAEEIDHRISVGNEFVDTWRQKCGNVSAEALDADLSRELQKHKVISDPQKLRLLTKKIFSGPLLLDSGCFKRDLKNLDGGCHALDMESGGFAWGWMALPVPDSDKPKMLVVKGISDYGDGSKGDTDHGKTGKSKGRKKSTQAEDERAAAIERAGGDTFRKIAMQRAWVTMTCLLDAGLMNDHS